MNQQTKNISQKDLDGWVEVFFVDPITTRFVSVVSKYFSKNPLIYTFVSFMLSILASFLVLQGYFVLAGLSYFMGMIFDGLDGKVARFNNNKVLLHGVLDGLTDMVKNLFLVLSIVYVFNDYYLWIIIFLILFLFYEFTYSMRLDLKIRYFSDDIVIKDYSMFSLKENYEAQIRKMNSRGLAILLQIYNFLFFYSSKLRTYPYPTLVDAEFSLYVLFLVTGEPIFIYLAVLFLLPDTIVSTILTLLLTINASRKRNGG